MKRNLLILVLVLQTGWLLGTVAQQELTLGRGRLVRLETVPVDPRDALRGDFIQLNYPISNLPRNVFSPSFTNEPPVGTRVYAILTPSGTNQFWTIHRASLSMLVPGEGEVLIKGKTTRNWMTSPDAVHVEYGIEKYFVAEGTGNPNGKVTVEAAIGRFGQARIKEVYVNGVPYVQAMR